MPVKRPARCGIALGWPPQPILIMSVVQKDKNNALGRMAISFNKSDTDEDLDFEEFSSEDELQQQEEPSPLSSPPTSPGPDADAEDDCLVYGLCNVVNIRFDN